MFKIPNKVKNKALFSHLHPNTIQINENQDEVIFFIHGGGFMYEMDLYYYDFFQRLATATNKRIIIPIYPTTPKVTHVEIFEFILSEYQYVIGEIKPQSIILLGDSAGGNLCLKLGLHLLDKQPDKIITISPWLDISTTNPAMQVIEKDDPFLTIALLQNCAKIYAAQESLTSPLLSPLFGKMDQLKNTTIMMGTHDILYADYLISQKKFPNITHLTYPNMIHCFALLEENKVAFDDLVNIIKA